MTIISNSAEQRVVLDNISWPTYLALLEDADGCRGRIAYDQGVLEIMAPSWLHEAVNKLIGRMIEVFTEERNIEMVSGRSTTWKREDVKRGFEADESYYIAHAAAVRGKDSIDLTVDPPPDLVIEVDISRSSLNKFGIYRALGVPEVWRYDGQSLRAYVLQGNDYMEVERSAQLPQLSMAVLVGFLNQRGSVGETELIRSFRAWVREQGGF
jgi:Uma2 family endonuclease